MATIGPALSAREQIVTIYLDANGTPVRVDPDTFKISKGAHHEVVWLTNPPNRPFTITFDAESPFYENNFSDGNWCSGLVKREIDGDDDKPGRKRYEYTVSVGANAIDPGGVVDR